MNNNDLRCLNFDKCDPNDTYDLNDKRIYSKVTPTELLSLCKK